MNFKKNMGEDDRKIRFFIGGAILFYGIISQQLFGWVGIVGLIVLATAYFRTCPAYMPLGIDTSKK